MSSLKHVKRTNGSALNVASALAVCVCVCVCVCVVLHLDIMLFSFQRLCLFFFPDVPRCCQRNNTICIMGVSVFEQKKKFALHATTHALSLHPLSCLCLFRVAVSSIFFV